MAPAKRLYKKSSHGQHQTHAAPRGPPANAARGHAHGALHADMQDRMRPDLRRELDGLRKYERQIMAGLKDPVTARLFFNDPRAALNKMKVPLSPAAATALRDARPPAELLQPKAFRLPNGQVVTPKLTIRFTKEE